MLEKTNFCATGNLTWNFLKIETTSPETTRLGLLCIWIWTLFTSATQTVSPNWVSMIGCVSSRFHCLFACDHNPPFNYKALDTAVAWVSGEITHKCFEQDTSEWDQIRMSFIGQVYLHICRFFYSCFLIKYINFFSLFSCLLACLLYPRQNGLNLSGINNNDFSANILSTLATCF